MRKITAASLLLVPLLLIPIAYAAPTPASGAFQVTNVALTSIRQVDSICLIELDAIFALQGTLTGSFVAHFRIVHRGPCGEAAPEIFEAQGTYGGTVDTASGTFDFNFRGSIDAQGNAQGELVILRGTGDLVDLRGMLTLTGQAGVGGTYTGLIHFDP